MKRTTAGLAVEVALVVALLQCTESRIIPEQQQQSSPANCCDPDIHGDNHPPVSVHFDSEPLEHIAVGRIRLRFSVVGAVPGFKYKIMVDNLQWTADREQHVIQQEELVFSIGDVHSRYHAKMEFDVPTDDQDQFRVVVYVVDMCTTLTSEEAIVARRDGTFVVPRVAAGDES